MALTTACGAGSGCGTSYVWGGAQPLALKERVEDHLFEQGVQRQMQCVNACEVVSSRDNDIHVNVGKADDLW